MEWNDIKQGDYQTYPKEGFPVLVSDGTGNYDVAWFIMSGEYKWVKDDVVNDALINFTSFIITKWSYFECV